ncbi:hypothetical protein H2203_007488 [Taxawa tesnikishii (nom. ined.)]|nr:hypothetical protein H2203_007488 [Dothideales sp. JES 119]
MACMLEEAYEELLLLLTPEEEAEEEEETVGEEEAEDEVEETDAVTGLLGVLPGPEEEGGELAEELSDDEVDPVADEVSSSVHVVEEEELRDAVTGEFGVEEGPVVTGALEVEVEEALPPLDSEEDEELRVRVYVVWYVRVVVEFVNGTEEVELETEAVTGEFGVEDGPVLRGTEEVVSYAGTVLEDSDDEEEMEEDSLDTEAVTGEFGVDV